MSTAASKEEATFTAGEVVAVYCRVSTDSEDQINSLENQKTFFANFAKERGLTIYKIYYDEGLTGTSWTRRDGFNNFLKAAGLDVVKEIDRNTLKEKTSYTISKKRAPKFSKVLIKNTSRFARNVLSMELIKMLRQNNVLIYFLDQRLITTTSNDFILNLFLNFDENDSRDKSIKVRFGFREGARKGRIYIGGGKLYGYDYHAETNTLTRNEEEAEVVRLIFDMYTRERLGIRVICNKLTAAGYKTAKGGSEWGKTTVRNILSNEKYAGKNPIQKFDSGMVLENKHWPKLREGYEVADTDRIEPIISWEQFQEAKSIRESKTAKYDGKRTGRKNIYGRYTKLIKCSQCGSFYIRNTDYRTKKKTPESKYYFYNCGGKKKHGVKYCNSPNILEEDLNKVIRALAYGKLREEIELRLSNLRSLLLIVADLLRDEIDESKEAEAAGLSVKIAEESEKLATMYKKLLSFDDVNGIVSKMIAEQEQAVTALKNAYNEANEYNSNIISQIRELLTAYEEAEDVAHGLKRRYSEEEVLSMIQYIYIDTAQYFEFGNINPTYKILAHLEDILRPYSARYNINIENWQHSHTCSNEERDRISAADFASLSEFCEQNDRKG